MLTGRARFGSGSPGQRDPQITPISSIKHDTHAPTDFNGAQLSLGSLSASSVQSVDRGRRQFSKSYLQVRFSLPRKAEGVVPRADFEDEGVLCFAATTDPGFPVSPAR